MIMMNDERWYSPFPCTIPFVLFKKHFTELNAIYWAHVPASNTIKKKASEKLTDNDDPKQFFLIQDEDDRRLAPTFSQWKEDYQEFLNYNRMNMLMLLSSIFETYLRTIVSLSFESKPGIIIKAPNAIDGVFLLKKDYQYGEYGSKSYMFTNEVDMICRGEWNNRITNFIKFFGSFSITEQKLQELDQLRKDRNLLGHYFGRKKAIYEAPLLINPSSAERISHNRFIKYCKTVFAVASKMDNYLQKNIIGSYDIIKYYFQYSKEDFNSSIGEQARRFKSKLGKLGLNIIEKNYYRNLISYCWLDSEDDTYKFVTKSIIVEINAKLKDLGIELRINGHACNFSSHHLSLFDDLFSIKSNPEYCKKTISDGKVEYLFSEKLIIFIVNEISKDPENIIKKFNILTTQTFENSSPKKTITPPNNETTKYPKMKWE